MDEELQLPYKRIAVPRGGCRIWEEPMPGMRYVCGIDTSGGGPKGDFAVASMIEVNSRRLVAVYRGKYDPTEWGKMCARFGWLYNTAMLAFETHPSQHGLSACLAARDVGYTLLYRRLQETTITHRMTEELGWATTERTKGRMVDYVRVALAEDYECDDVVLLQELLTGKYQESGKIIFDGHDDCFVSYAIALRVAHIMVERGFVSAERPEPSNWQESWWSARKQALEAGTPGGRPQLRAWNGT